MWVIWQFLCLASPCSHFSKPYVHKVFLEKAGGENLPNSGCKARPQSKWEQVSEASGASLEQWWASDTLYTLPHASMGSQSFMLSKPVFSDLWNEAEETTWSCNKEHEPMGFNNVAHTGHKSWDYSCVVVSSMSGSSLTGLIFPHPPPKPTFLPFHLFSP